MEQKNQRLKESIQMVYRLSDKTVGYAEKVDNCWNYSIFAMDRNVSYLNEFHAGYIQGKLQGEGMLKAARNNTWKNLYLTDTSHSFPRQCPPSKEELQETEKLLRENLSHLFDWICAPENKTSKVADDIFRLYLRMEGIYQGATGYEEPIISSYDDNSADEISLFKEKYKLESKDKLHKMMDLPLGYGNDPLSFLDVYFINAQMDLADAVAQSHESKYGLYKSDHCSAFLKRTGDDIFWTHNSWCGFLTQSMTISYSIYDYDVRKMKTKGWNSLPKTVTVPGNSEVIWTLVSTNMVSVSMKPLIVTPKMSPRNLVFGFVGELRRQKCSQKVLTSFMNISR